MTNPDELGRRLAGFALAVDADELGADIAAALRAYGDERAAQERERCARIVGDWAAVPGSDLDDCAAAIRNLPPDHTQREPRDTR